MMMGCFYRCVKQITVGISICKSRKNDVDFNAAVKGIEMYKNVSPFKKSIFFVKLPKDPDSCDFRKKMP